MSCFRLEHDLEEVAEFRSPGRKLLPASHHLFQAVQRKRIEVRVEEPEALDRSQDASDRFVGVGPERRVERKIDGEARAIRKRCKIVKNQLLRTLDIDLDEVEVVDSVGFDVPQERRRVHRPRVAAQGRGAGSRLRSVVMSERRCALMITDAYVRERGHSAQRLVELAVARSHFIGKRIRLDTPEVPAADMGGVEKRRSDPRTDVDT